MLNTDVDWNSDQIEIYEIETSNKIVEEATMYELNLFDQEIRRLYAILLESNSYYH